MASPKKARKPPARAVKKKAAPRRPARPVPVATPLPAPEVALEPLRPARVLALLALVAVFAAGAFNSLQQKAAQHVVAPRLGPILWQGDKPESISYIQALKARPGGGFVTLLRRPQGWRIQAWNGSLTMTAYADIQAKAVGPLVDLACLTDGQLWVAASDGRIWRLDAHLKPSAPFQSGVKALSALEALPAGGAVALDVINGELWRLGADGQPGTGIPSSEASASKCLTVLPDGGLALLQSRPQGLWVCVLDPAFQVQKRFEVRGISESAPTRMAAAGDVLMINDSKGSVGVVFYHRSGKPLGNTLGVGKFPIAHPGWVSGDPGGEVAYIHYADGLVKVGLPWGGQH